MKIQNRFLKSLTLLFCLTGGTCMVFGSSTGTGSSGDMLSSIDSKDQWDNRVKWEAFVSVPKILVFGGKEAAMESRAWGTYFQKKFNQGYEPVPEHLQVLNTKEQIKIIAVAALPDVPSLFKGLFRSGFKKEAATMGMILDFAPGLSHQVGYKENGAIPTVVLFSKNGQLLKKFSAMMSDEKTKAEIDLSVESLIKSL